MYGYVKVCISFVRFGIILLITSLYAVPPGMGPQDIPFLLETQIKSLVARTLALDPVR